LHGKRQIRCKPFRVTPSPQFYFLPSIRDRIREDSTMIKRKVGKIPGHTHELEMARQRGIKPSTQQKERSQGRGPPYVVVNRQVHYNDAGYLKWLEAQLHVPVRSERGAA
jgi:hypothetical protein